MRVIENPVHGPMICAGCMKAIEPGAPPGPAMIAVSVYHVRVECLPAGWSFDEAGGVLRRKAAVPAQTTDDRQPDLFAA